MSTSLIVLALAFILQYILVASSVAQPIVRQKLHLTTLPMLEPTCSPLHTDERLPEGGSSCGEPGEDRSSSKRQRKNYHGLCPLCGVTKEISHTANHRTVVIASHADPDTAALFKSQEVSSLDDSFRVCKPCSSVVLHAIKILCDDDSPWNDYLGSIMQKKTTRNPSKCLQSALTSQGQPLVSLFRSIASRQRAVNFPPPSMASEAVAPRKNVYAVGDLVNLPRRKQANVNEDGGVAVVLSFRSAQVQGESGIFYSVKHTVGSHHVENNLPESLLEPYSYDTGKKRRSVDAEAKAKAVAEERELEKLRKDNARLQERLRNLEADVLRAKLMKKELRVEFKEAKRAASDLAKKNEELTVKMTAQYELMQRTVFELLAEAKSKAQSEAAEAMTQAQGEAASARSKEREKRSEQMRQHAQEVKALKGEVREATAARLQLESTVGSTISC